MSEEDKQHLSHFHNKVVELNKCLKEWQYIISMRDKTIASLQDQLKSLQSMNTNQDDKINQLQKTIDDKDAEIRRLKEEMAAILKQNEEDRKKNDEEVRQLQQIRNDKYSEMLKSIVESDTLLTIPKTNPEQGGNPLASSTLSYKPAGNLSQSTYKK